MEWSEGRYWIVTLRHDAGIVRIRTFATTATAAGRMACCAENAPFSAVVSVKPAR